MRPTILKSVGYASIDNMLLEAIMFASWNYYEMKIILAVLRKTNGWSKQSSLIGLGEISRMTEIQRAHVWRSCSALVRDKVLNREASLKPGGKCVLSINKKFSDWKNRFKNGVPLVVDNNGKGSPVEETGEESSVASTGDTTSPLQETAEESSVASTGDTPITSAGDTLKQQNNGFKSNIKTTVDGLLKKAVDKSDKKGRLVGILQGREKELKAKNPLNLIDEICAAGFDRDLTWAYVVQCRDKQNPPGWVINALTNPRYAPADWAFEQAREERRRLGL